MKTFIYTTNKNLITIIVLCFFILLSGCKKEPINPDRISADRTDDNSSTENINCEALCEKTVDLMAGQHIKVGTVHYKNNPDGNVDITYTVNTPWELTFVSLYIGNCSQIPKNSTGNPIPGHFPYKYTLPDGTTSYLIRVPRDEVPTCGCIAAHASVKNTQTGATETAWGKGNRFTYSNWAMYYQYCLSECTPTDCAMHATYWFVNTESPWPASITVGDYNYTREDAVNIWFSSNFEGIPDSKHCFIYVASIKLSSATISQNSPVWQDVQICENYLKGLNYKLDPDNLPTNNQSAFEAAERIRIWMKQNECNVTVK